MANGGVQGLLSNPLFMAGMGLLQNQGRDPYGGLLSGLSTAQQNQLSMDERRRQEELRRQMTMLFAGDQAGGQAGRPQTQQQAQTMAALTAGGQMPEAGGELMPSAPNPVTRPAGLLSGQPSSVAQQTPYIPTDADIDADPSVWVAGQEPPEMAAEALSPTGPGILAETPGDTIGTPRQEMAAAQSDAQGLLGEVGSVAGGTAMPQDVRHMFGLLAQYGDPAEAAQGYMNYQLAQQRLTQQASQARTRGFSPIVDNDGKVWFADHKAPGGVVPAINPETNEQITAPAGITYQTDAAGNVHALPKQVMPGSGAPTPQTVISATDVERDVQTRADIEKQGNARRSLGGIEDLIAQPGGAWETVNAMLSDEMSGARELMTGGSAPFGQLWSYVPGTDAAGFRALQDKLGSQAFIDSITQLRQQGGTVGQITEREGAKLEQARLRLINATSEDMFKRELENFRDSLRAFLQAARREAGVDVDAPFVPGGVDFRTEGQRARDEAAAVEVEGSRLQELQQRYPGTGGN